MAIRGRCCQCAATGLCKRCLRVSSGRPCSNCYPAKQDCCHNHDAAQIHLTTTDSHHMTSETHQHDHVSTQGSLSPRPSCSHSLLVDGPSNSVMVQKPELDLLAYGEIAKPGFSWGNLDTSSMCDLIGTIYKEIVHWKPNLFKIPSGNVGIEVICVGRCKTI